MQVIQFERHPVPATSNEQEKCGTGRASLRYKRHKRAEKAHTVVEVIPHKYHTSFLSSLKRFGSSHLQISGRNNAVFVDGFVFFPRNFQTPIFETLSLTIAMSLPRTS